MLKKKQEARRALVGAPWLIIDGSLFGALSASLSYAGRLTSIVPVDLWPKDLSRLSRGVETSKLKSQFADFCCCFVLLFLSTPRQVIPTPEHDGHNRVFSPKVRRFT